MFITTPNTERPYFFTTQYTRWTSFLPPSVEDYRVYYFLVYIYQITVFFTTQNPDDRVYYRLKNLDDRLYYHPKKLDDRVYYHPRYWTTGFITTQILDDCIFYNPKYWMTLFITTQNTWWLYLLPP